MARYAGRLRTLAEAGALRQSRTPENTAAVVRHFCEFARTSLNQSCAELPGGIDERSATGFANRKILFVPIPLGELGGTLD
jgi:hypothetical protein